MPKINSRNKGACGEREFAKKLIELFGVEARRGQQFSGSKDSPDVVTSIKGVHWEVKRVEALNIEKAIDQATRDGGLKNIPVVAHRKNGRNWLITVELDKLKALSVIFADLPDRAEENFLD